MITPLPVQAETCVRCNRPIYSYDPPGRRHSEWFHKRTGDGWCDPDATTVATPAGEIGAAW